MSHERSMVSPRSTAASSPLLGQAACVQAETPERESGQNPRDCNCNPDDVHNLASPHDQSSTHPIRYACMQVDAWASNIPGVRWWYSGPWQSAKARRRGDRRRPVLFMLDRPAEVRQNIAWRVKSTLVECRAARERAMLHIHKLSKAIGTVSVEVATACTGDFKPLAKTISTVSPMKIHPWVKKKAVSFVIFCVGGCEIHCLTS